jgi:hypothetical protein
LKTISRNGRRRDKQNFKKTNKQKKKKQMKILKDLLDQGRTILSTTGKFSILLICNWTFYK